MLTSKITNGITNEQQTNNKQITTNKNDKNERMKENICGGGTGEKNAIEYYTENINPIITQYEIKIINSYLENISDELMIYAIDISIGNNARSLNYIKSIINRWINTGIKTIEQAKAEQKQFNENKTKPKLRKKEVDNSNLERWLAKMEAKEVSQ